MGQVTIVTPPGAVARGHNATLAARAAPGATCSIVVRYPSGPAAAAGLVAKSADPAGNVAWSWLVGGSTTPGTFPVQVSCGGATATASLTVTP